MNTFGLAAVEPALRASPFHAAQERPESHDRGPALDTQAQHAPRAALVGSSLAMKGLHAAIARLAPVDSTVLLSGETGTGKELAARALHQRGARAAAPFVPVDCATLSPGRVESELFGQGGTDGLFVHARGGTLFLDDVGELPLPLQASFLRVLEERRVRPIGSRREVEVDVRIIAATRSRLADEVAAGRFRKELYYRLQVIEITLPPLRAHKEDIAALVAHFTGLLAPSLGAPPIDITSQDMMCLQQYDWPGNVRELRNLIERSLIAGALNVSSLYQGLSRAQMLAPTSAATQPHRAAPTTVAAATDLQAVQKRHILAVLDAARGDKTRAARLLGISRRTLERRCAQWAGA